jgi:hypothetical protein
VKLSPLAVELLCAVALALIALIIAPGPGALAVGVVVVLALVAFSLVPSAIGARRRWRRSDGRPMS